MFHPFFARAMISKTPAYPWVLFDADGTLFDYDRAESAALEKVFRLHSLPFSESCVPAYRIVNQALWRQLENGRITAELLKVRRFEQLLEKLGLSHSAEEISREYLECLAESSELVEGALELLRALKGKCTITIVTNGLTVVQKGRIAKSPIRGLVEEVVISEEIGHAKPAPGFFDVVFGRLGRPPKDQVIMVGDNWSSDVIGAINYGIDACWFNPRRQPRPDTAPVKYEIGSLRELAPIILGLATQ